MQPSWLLIFASYLLFPLHTTHSTPIQTGRGRGEPCVHQSIAELIKTSPVILKALAAHIFTDDDLNGVQQIVNDGSGEQQELHNNWQHEQNNFLTSAATLEPTSRTTWHSGSSKSVRRAADDIAMMASTTMESILITLTPETIYKGASLLKMTPGAESAARNSGSGSYSSGSSSGNTVESAYQYEGQLNATLQPLSCFDANVLKILPTELIAFGKLVTVQQPLQRVESPQHTPAQQQTEVLRISINGLHRWSPQFENHIWKHLGWDNWSDFTLCSVTCGKGVQQRFRRCLLDNPMVNLNMNMNLNAADCNGDDDVTGNDGVADDVDDDVDVEKAEIANELKNGKYSASRSSDSVKSDETTANVLYSGVNEALLSKDNMLRKSKLKDELAKKTDVATSDVTVADDIVVIAVDEPHSHSQQQWTKTTSNNNDDDVSVNAVDGADEEVMRVFEGNFNGSREKWQKRNGNNKHKQRGKRRKTTKSFSTMFCEGYNIEQRNCNSFECSDDISDLLKFYKRILTPEDIANIASPEPVVSASATIDFDQLTTAGATVTPVTVDVASETTTATVGTAALPSPTPLNMGYVRSWRNALNFTLMLTLRVKNDSKTTATIFSIRNATHNLYLEPCKDGLRLYLERDSTTEMLAVKFNLYDYRWHQVAISIQNGDFISIYVDCSWTNSFVVSKRLFSLPLDADVEIGRGFNGELQQLLVLPDNQERHQCSNKRTSINEVKRYIIDTFIDDYSN